MFSRLGLRFGYRHHGGLGRRSSAEREVVDARRGRAIEWLRQSFRTTDTTPPRSTVGGHSTSC
jgi:hypothetical protein